MEISQVQQDDILRRVANLMAAYDKGLLGGKVMPEDANPGLAKNSAENCAYFTLPMALNYQRNSYTLWQSALQTYEDENTRDIFVPQLAAQMDIALLREKLMAYKLAIQPTNSRLSGKPYAPPSRSFLQGMFVTSLRPTTIPWRP